MFPSRSLTRSSVPLNQFNRTTRCRCVQLHIRITTTMTMTKTTNEGRNTTQKNYSNHCQNVLKMQSIITQKISEYSIIRHCHVMDSIVCSCVRMCVCHQQTFIPVHCVVAAVSVFAIIRHIYIQLRSPDAHVVRTDAVYWPDEHIFNFAFILVIAQCRKWPLGQYEISHSHTLDILWRNSICLTIVAPFTKIVNSIHSSSFRFVALDWVCVWVCLCGLWRGWAVVKLDCNDGEILNETVVFSRRTYITYKNLNSLPLQEHFLFNFFLCFHFFNE